MTLKNIGYFIAVADCLSFTQAAAQCFVTQPALSRAIQELESELDCALFERNGSSITLTKEGWHCYRLGKKLLNDSEKMAHEIRRVGQPKHLGLKLGYHFHLHILFFAERLSRLKEEYPDIEFEVYREESTSLIGMLKKGTLDWALLPFHMVEGHPDIRYHRFCPGMEYVLINRKHPLSGQSCVALSDLRNELLVSFDPASLPECSSNIQEIFDRKFQPFEPRVATTIADMLVDVYLNNAIGLVSSCAQVLHNQFVAALPISDFSPDIGPVAAWLSAGKNPACALIDAFFKNGQHYDP